MEVKTVTVSEAQYLFWPLDGSINSAVVLNTTSSPHADICVTFTAVVTEIWGSTSYPRHRIAAPQKIAWAVIISFFKWILNSLTQTFQHSHWPGIDSSEWSVAVSSCLCYLGNNNWLLKPKYLLSSLFNSRKSLAGESDTMSPPYSPLAWARSSCLWAAFCQRNPHDSEVSALGCRMQARCPDIYFPSTSCAKQILITLVQITITSVMVWIPLRLLLS